jgi:hypothetical protein
MRAITADFWYRPYGVSACRFPVTLEVSWQSAWFQSCDFCWWLCAALGWKHSCAETFSGQDRKHSENHKLPRKQDDKCLLQFNIPTQWNSNVRVSWFVYSEVNVESLSSWVDLAEEHQILFFLWLINPCCLKLLYIRNLKKMLSKIRLQDWIFVYPWRIHDVIVHGQYILLSVQVGILHNSLSLA